MVVERVEPFLTLQVTSYGNYWHKAKCPELGVGGQGKGIDVARAYLNSTLKAASFYIEKNARTGKLSPEDQARLPLARKVMESIRKGIPSDQFFSPNIVYISAVEMDGVWIIPS